MEEGVTDGQTLSLATFLATMISLCVFYFLIIEMPVDCSGGLF